MKRSLLLLVCALPLFSFSLPAAAETHGIHRAYMDTTVSPCSDFYQYANGKWIEEAEIPSSYSGIGAGRDVYDRNQETLYRVLEKSAAAAATEKDPTLQKVGFLYATLMDSARADREGWQPIAADLKRIDQIQSRDDLRKAFAWFTGMGLRAPFIFGSEADPKESQMNIAQIYQGGLGLPDRDYYFRTDPKSDSLRIEYVAHMARVFELLGTPPQQAQSDADRVMELETALAESSMTRTAQRDPHAVYHKMGTQELAKLAPNIEWSSYFDEVGLPALAKSGAMLDVSQPGFVTRLNSLVETTPIEDWRVYLRWHLVNAASNWLGQKFFDERFSFTSKLYGTPEAPPRWKRSAQAVNRAMGEALGKAYVEVAFPPSSKAQMMELVNNLSAAYRERIQSRPWMSAETKDKALKKLDAIIKKIGYPDKWRDYSKLAIAADVPAVENLRHAQEFEARRDLNKIGKPVDRAEWFMSPPTVNAYYNPSNNEIVFPAGILEPPFFDPKADDAVNYGAIGMVIGHEITHGFDDRGRQFDADGNLTDWWTETDADRFKKRAEMVVEQYDGYVAVDTLHVNGQLTLGENIADLGGLTIAYHAWQRSLRGKPHPPDIDGFTPEQRFFLGAAQAWRSKLRAEINRLYTLTDPHSPPYWRINGPFSNMPEFAKAFGCKAGDKMVRPDDKRAEIW